MTEQTPSPVAEDSCTGAAGGQVKTPLPVLYHPPFPRPAAPHWPLESWEWEKPDSWSLHLLLLNFCAVINQHFHF